MRRPRRGAVACAWQGVTPQAGQRSCAHSCDSRSDLPLVRTGCASAMGWPVRSATPGLGEAGKTSVRPAETCRPGAAARAREHSTVRLCMVVGSSAWSQIAEVRGAFARAFAAVPGAIACSTECNAGNKCKDPCADCVCGACGGADCPCVLLENSRVDLRSHDVTASLASPARCTPSASRGV